MSDLSNFQIGQLSSFVSLSIRGNMKLNHLNLVVSDVLKATALFRKHFGFRSLEERKDAMSVLTNEDHFVLIFWSSQLNKEHAVNYPENFHIGFYQPDKNTVQKIYEDLRNEGLTFEGEPKKMRNTFGFYCYFEGLMIEVSVLPS